MRVAAASARPWIGCRSPSQGTEVLDSMDAGPVAPDVTSLTAEAASFFSRSLVGCEKGQSSPEDVVSSMLVGVRGVTTRLTAEHCLADAVLFGGVTATATAVGGVPGIYAYHCASSLFRFGAQDRDEGSPARIGDTSVQPGLGCLPVGQECPGGIWVGTGLGPADHVGDLEVLDGDHVIAAHQVAGGVVVEVPSLIGDLAVPGRHRLAGRPTIVRSSFLASQDSLGVGELVRGPTSVAGVVDVLSRRGGSEAGDAHVDAYHFSGRLQQPGRNIITRQHQHPLAALPANLDRLHPTLHDPMRGDLDVADALEVHTAGLGLPPAPVAFRWPFHAVEAMRGPETGVTGSLAYLDSAEERPERRVETIQLGLLGRARPPGHLRAHRTDLFQLCRLGAIADRHLRPAIPEKPRGAAHRSLVCIPALLERPVVQLAVVVQTCLQPQMLALGGPQTELVRPSHASWSHWWSMYRRTLLSETYPTEAAKYDFDHRN